MLKNNHDFHSAILRHIQITLSFQCPRQKRIHGQERRARGLLAKDKDFASFSKGIDHDFG